MYGGVPYGSLIYGGGLLQVPEISSEMQYIVNGAIKTGLLSERTFLTTVSDLNTRDSATLQIVDLKMEEVVEAGDEIIIRQAHERLFAGTVEERTLRATRNAKARFIDVQVVDFNQIADRHFIIERFDTPGQTLGDVVRAIVTKYLSADGISTTFVQDGPELGVVSFPNVPASKAFDDLEDLTGYKWNIDYSKSLHFFASDTNVAPWSITDTEWNSIELISRKSRARYRNRQQIVAGQETSDATLTEPFSGTGSKRTFTVSHPIAEEPAIKVNGVVQTVGIRDVDTGKQWYWSKGRNTVTQDRTEPIVPDGVTGDVTFKYLFGIFVELEDEAEIASRKLIEGGSGIYTALESQTSLDDSGLAIDRGLGLLRRFGKISEELRITTDKAGLRAGQLLSVKRSDLEIDGEYLVETVEASNLLRGERFRYVVRALSGEGVGGWAEFFKKAAREGREFTIRENEVLVTLRKVKGQVELSDVVTIPSGDQLGDWQDDPYTVFRFGASKFGYQTRFGTPVGY